MVVYSLESAGNNNGEYEDFWDFNNFHGVFSTIEKAKEFAEKLIEEEKERSMKVDTWKDGKPESYKSTFKMVHDWDQDGTEIITKNITRGAGYMEEWDIYYSITKVNVDPEYKKED